MEQERVGVATPVQILRRYWGYESFRPGQEDVITSVVQGRDTLGLLPTGGGKSVIYQVAGLSLGGLTLVVTPLIALMDDQVAHLQDRGLRAAAIHSGLPAQELDRRLEAASNQELQFLYLSPERLRTERLLARLHLMRVTLLAVDEAHCISEWGQDFRPAYRQIRDLREHLPGVPILAVTATATPVVVEDIVQQLALREHQLFTSTLERPGLRYRASRTADKLSVVRSLLASTHEAAIVYGVFRREVENAAAVLRSFGIAAAAYHGGMDAATRSEVQAAWMRGDTQVMVATNAFGMGIDRSDVRQVIHLGLPLSIEAYYQEAGRAGRDGQGGTCLLLWDEADVVRLRENLRAKYPSRKLIDRVVRKLYSHLHLEPGEPAQAEYPICLETFEQEYGLRARGVLQLLKTEGLLQLGEGPGFRYFLRMEIEPRELESFRTQDEVLDRLFRHLLAAYPGIRNDFVEVSTSALHRALAVSYDHAAMRIADCVRKGWLAERWWTATHTISFPEGRVPRLPLLASTEGVLRRYQADRVRLLAMVDYAAGRDRCRERVLREYFGEEVTQDCGRCDYCLARRS